jgi:hypothetical protein
MAEIISLDSLRRSKPLREILREVLAKQRTWVARQKELENMIWMLERMGEPLKLIGQNEPLDQTAARAKLASDLYEAIATQQTLWMYRSYLRQCIRAAAAGKIKKVEVLLERAGAIAEGGEAWDAYARRKMAAGEPY